MAEQQHGSRKHVFRLVIASALALATALGGLSGASATAEGLRLGRVAQG